MMSEITSLSELSPRQPRHPPSDSEQGRLCEDIQVRPLQGTSKEITQHLEGAGKLSVMVEQQRDETQRTQVKTPRHREGRVR